MSKVLESLERLAMPDELHIKECKKLGIGLTEDYDVVEQALKRLESIDNANPSEAMKCLNRMLGYASLDENDFEEVSDDYDAIKQVLLKAQEPKQYLKWEDLEFDHKPKYINVKMGDNKYLLIVGFSDGGNEMAILQTKLRRYYFVESEDNKQFFNDLHLEKVVEE